MRRDALFVLVALWGFSSTSRADSTVEVLRGYLACDRFSFDPSAPFDRQLGGLWYSPAGEPIVYENGEIRLSGGVSTTVLATFDPPVFGGLATPAPDGTAIYFGESSSGNIYLVPLDGAGPVLVDNLTLNFDLAFAPRSSPDGIAGRGFVSSPRSFASANSIWLLDAEPESENDEIVTNMPRFSGPLAFDPDGSLYYITAGADLAGDGERLVRFSTGQLLAGIGDDVVDFSEGEILTGGIESAYSLEWYEGRLFLTNLGADSGRGAVEIIDPRDGFAHSVFATFPVNDGTANPSYLAVRRGTTAFEPGAGPEAGSLLVAYSDFSTVSNVVEITAELFFVRGRINADDEVDISDAIALLGWLFAGGSEPHVLAAADVNSDGDFDLSDAVYLLEFLFRGGPEIPPPFPDPGPDPAGENGRQGACG